MLVNSELLMNDAADSGCQEKNKCGLRICERYTDSHNIYKKGELEYRELIGWRNEERKETKDETLKQEHEIWLKQSGWKDESKERHEG